jgi:hypothetical protein
MKCRKFPAVVLTAALYAAATPAGAAEDSMWARLTVLLEPSPSVEVGPEQMLTPGGLVFTDELDDGDVEQFDTEADRRVRRIGAKITEVESAMRLAPLMVRQYQIRLSMNRIAPIPTLDLNPRLGANLVLRELTWDVASFDVEFLHASGDWETPEFEGEPITLGLQSADLREVLAMFSKVTGRTIVVDPDVEGEVSVDFRGVPWDQALDLILRTNDLGWVEEGDAIRVSRLEDLNRRRDVLAKATVAVDRSPGGLAMIAGRDGPKTPTVVLIVEPLAEEPPMPARHAGLVRFRRYVPPAFSASAPAEGLVVVRIVVAEDGQVEDPVVVSSPSESDATAVMEAAAGWRLAPVLDQDGRHRRALVAFGIRTSIGR